MRLTAAKAVSGYASQLPDVIFNLHQPDGAPLGSTLRMPCDSGSEHKKLLRQVLAPAQQAAIRHQVRTGLLTQLCKRSQKTRSDVLELCADTTLFASPFVDSATLAAIARAIIDVCRAWRWL